MILKSAQHKYAESIFLYPMNLSGPVLLLSKLIEMLSGYFDPETISFGTQIK